MEKTGSENQAYRAEFKTGIIMDMREHHLGYCETVRKHWDITTGKEDNYKNAVKRWERISNADIVNNLTSAADKPLSAAQGKALKEMIDDIDIPTALPNPNTLTIKIGDSTVTYDGSEAVSITEYAAPMIIMGNVAGSSSTSINRWYTPIPEGQSIYDVILSAYNAHREIIVDIDDGSAWDTILRLVKFEHSELYFEFSNYEITESTSTPLLQTLRVYDDGSTSYSSITPATDSDIPTTLPNPNSLTFTGGVSKSYNGSSAVTVEIPQKPAAYVTASGTSGIWQYKKWSDGTAECWGIYNGTGINAARNNYMGFYYSDVIRLNLPITFSSEPVITVSGGGLSSMTIARTGPSTATQAGIWIVSAVSTATSVDASVYIMVKGNYAA